MRHQRSDHPLAARGDPPGRRARRILAVLSAAASLSLLLPTTAYAEPAADAEATTHPVVASYASDYSVTIIEAQRRLERIPQLQQVLASLHEIEADRLAGWGIDHHGKMTAWVWLNGDEAPRPQASALADAHADVEIRTGAAFTFAELVAAQNRFGFGEAVGAIGNTGATDGGQRLFSDVITHTGIDLSANALEIGVHAESIPVPPSVFPGAGDLGPVGPVGETGTGSNGSTTLDYVETLLAEHINVSYYAVESERVGLEVAFEGGRSLGNRQCTSGFTARQDGTGRHGIITAGHCNRDTFVTQGVTVDRAVQVWTSSNDAALFLIPQNQNHSVTNRFVCDGTAGDLLTCRAHSIGPSRLMMMGDHVCHYGVASGRSCGTVDDVRYSPTGTCGSQRTTCQGVFVRVRGPSVRSCQGDSGGPVFSYTAAYGIHRGSNSGNDCSRTGVTAHFSDMRRVQSVLRARVVTNWTEAVL